MCKWNTAANWLIVSISAPERKTGRPRKAEGGGRRSNVEFFARRRFAAPGEASAKSTESTIARSRQGPTGAAMSRTGAGGDELIAPRIRDERGKSPERPADDAHPFPIALRLALNYWTPVSGHVTHLSFVHRHRSYIIQESNNK